MTVTVAAGQASGSTTATAASVASTTNVTVTGTYNNSSQSGTITVTPTIETITIVTNPPNLTVTVDNVNYTAPQSFQWGAGTSHSIAAPSPQNGITGGQYLFSGWSDGGAVAHSITVPSTPATYSASFSVVNFPLTVTGISPAAAAIGGQVTITGANFGSTAGTVIFHGTAATPANWSATSITVNVPSGASSGPVLVSAGGLDSNEWNFTVVPSVISVSPASGSAGTQVTILGSGFGATSGTVWLGSTPGSVVSWSNSQVVATVAANAVSGVAEVQQSGFSSNSVPFTVATPTISSLSSTSVLPGAQVTINGSGFGAAQGSGQVWLGTAYGSVQSWSNTQVVAAVAAGSMSGNARVLQGGVWSNAVGLSIDALQITGITPNSGTAGTSVTFTGTGFGSQSTGAVWLGSMAANVVSWTDTQVVATVASGSLSGIARIQQSGTWSNAEGFTVPTSGGNSLTPAMINMVVGDTHTIQATNAAGQSVTGLTWTSSNTSIVSLSTDDPPILTALAAGRVTITAGAGSADVTVSALGGSGSWLPTGTVLWTNPGSGSGVARIIPAVPSTTGVADVFALQNDGTIAAIKSDGTTAWISDVSAYVGNSSPNWAGVRADFQGGLALSGSSTNCFSCLVKVDGATGHVVFAYSAPFPADGGYLVHTDGTIFSSEQGGFNSTVFVKGIDPVSGTVKFTVPLLPPQSASSVYAGPFSPIIAGDGFAYYGYLDNESADGIAWATHLMLLRVDSSGNYTNIDVADSVGGGPVSGIEAWIVTNADQGVMVNWLWDSGSSGMALVNGTNVSLSSAPTIPGQMTMTYNVLQAQDGSFIGTADVGDDFTPYIVNFDASGNVRWSVPNDQPQIATADGSVIGQSGIAYDQNGNALGQIGSLPTYSWKGAYQIGSVNSILPIFDLAYIATSYAAVPNGNLTGNGFSLIQHSFGMVFCGHEGDGSCPAGSLWDSSPVKFSYLPVDSLTDKTYNAPPPVGPTDFSATYPNWTQLIKGVAYYTYVHAFDHFPAIVARQPAPTLANGCGGQTPCNSTLQRFEHTIFVTGDWVLHGGFSGLEEETTGITWPGLCTTNRVGHQNCTLSSVYYLALMGYAQQALKSVDNLNAPLSPVYQYPAPTDPSALAQFNAQFNQLMTATGIGLGNISVHETAHQVGAPHLDCSSPRSREACPEEYMYQNGNGSGRNEWFYWNIPNEKIHWDYDAVCVIQQYLLGPGYKDPSCQ